MSNTPAERRLTCSAADGSDGRGEDNILRVFLQRQLAVIYSRRYLQRCPKECYLQIQIQYYSLTWLETMDEPVTPHNLPVAFDKITASIALLKHGQLLSVIHFHLPAHHFYPILWTR